MMILLTGSSGFIGKRVLAALIDKFGEKSIKVIGKKAFEYNEPLLSGNRRGESAPAIDLNEVSHIIHIGAFTPKNSREIDDIQRSYSNIEFTKKLLDSDLKKLERFINISTIDVYEENLKIITESSTISPTSLYGLSKLYCEEMVKKAAEKNGFDYINLRVGHVYGPGEEVYEKALPNFFRKIIKGQPPVIFSDGSEIRSLIFIDDVVKSIVNSVNTRNVNLDINVVSSHAISLLDLANLVIRVSGKNIEPSVLCESVATKDYIFENELLKTVLLGVETDLEAGLLREYEHFEALYEANI